MRALFGWLAEKFELSRGGNIHNVRPMEGLRGFAVLLVFLVHYATLVEPWIAQDVALLALTDALHVIGQSGVDLFFVLSGYLIYGSLLSRQQRFLPFIARRIERIYPAFTAVFVLYLILSFAFPAENKIPASAGDAAIYLLQNFLLLPGLFPIRPMITVAWSLSYELFYYLAIPLVVGVFKLRSRSSAWRITLFLTAAASFAIYSAISGGPVRLLMFVSGTMLFEILKNTQLRASSTAGLIALMVGLSSLLLPIAEPAGLAIKVAVLFFTLLVLCVACFRTPSAWLPRAFSWTPLRWLGNMSYSFYLLHGAALQAAFLILKKFVPPAGDDATVLWAMALPALLLSLVASALLFLLIERPFSLAPRGIRSAPNLPQAASASESGS